MSTKPLPVAILVRVSTSEQKTSRHVSELTEYAATNGYKVVEICMEPISGNASEAGHEGLQRALYLAERGAVRKILVHEVSRLARRSSVANWFVRSLEAAGVSLYWYKQRVETLLDNGKRNPAASIMFALLAEMARIERESLIDRISSGLAEARRKGVKLGRPSGSAMLPLSRLRKHMDITRLLNQRVHSLRQIVKMTGKSKLTVQRVKAAWNGKTLAY